MLIQPRDSTPSMWRDFLDAGHEGMQHFAVWSEDYDGSYRQALKAGFRVAQEGNLTGRGRFVYFESEAHPGTVLELTQLTLARQQSAAAIREAALSWDGRDPIRRI